MYIGVNSGSVEDFTANLLYLLQDSRLIQGKICIVSDININLLDQESQRIGRFMDSLSFLCYFPCITKPTRFSNSSAPTLLDHRKLF